MAAAMAMRATAAGTRKVLPGFQPMKSAPRVLVFAPLASHRPRPPFGGVHVMQPWRLRRKGAAVCYLTKEETKAGGGVEEMLDAPQSLAAELEDELMKKAEERRLSATRATERMERKKLERKTYLVAAVMSSLGITSMAVAAVYYRFAWQMEVGGEVPIAEMLGTFALSVGAAVGMEFWARWAHRELWHASLWSMHESHHRPRDGPFELNDVFAITNAVPAITLLAYGFFNRGLFPGLCFGAGLGITMFGMAYMFVHDGLVHRRFPVGPIADVPYFQRVAAAHQIHHSDKFKGVPFGLFLGPKELEEVGGLEDLEKEMNRRIKAYKNNKSTDWNKYVADG